MGWIEVTLYAGEVRRYPEQMRNKGRNMDNRDISEMAVSIDQAIEQVEINRRDFVILGAGASKAALPNGDKNGNLIPLMDELTELLNLHSVFKSGGVDSDEHTSEEAFALLVKSGKRTEVRIVEAKIHEYFQRLELPDHPTIYDHLILGLRPKDVIATFNWDPFLIQAARRNRPVTTKAPRMLFLHGNVAVGYCAKDQIHGLRNMVCPDCGRHMTSSKLLYPISNKNYEDDPAIASDWKDAQIGLKDSAMFTVFGYRAPVSDKAAMQLLLDAWGGWANRQLEEVEIVDIRDEEDLRETWDDFIHTHHYGVVPSFYDSWIAHHPRRTTEAWYNQFLMAKVISLHPIPKDANFEELWNWINPYLEAENASSNSGEFVQCHQRWT